MKNIRDILHNFGQRITFDTVLTAYGELSRDNRHSLIRAALSSKLSGAVTLQKGSVIPSSGMVTAVEAGSAWVQVKDADEAWLIVLESQLALAAVTANVSGSPRYDLVEGRFSLGDTDQETVDIINPTSGVITPTANYTRKTVQLDTQIVPGTPACPSVTGPTNAVSPIGLAQAQTFDLSTDNKINLSIDGATAIEINCALNSVGTETVATAAEVAQSINDIIPGVASVSGGTKVLLTSTTTGEDSTIVFTPPSANDATNDIFGLAESGGYVYTYTGARGYFKLAEIAVPDLATVISASEIHTVDEQGSWTADVGNNVRVSDAWKHQTDATLDHPDLSVTEAKLSATVQARLDSGGLTDWTHNDGIVPGYLNQLDVVYRDESPEGDGLAADEVRVRDGAGTIDGDSVVVDTGSEQDVQLKHTPTGKSPDTLDTRIQVGQTLGVPVGSGDYEVLDFSGGVTQDLKCYFDTNSAGTGVANGQGGGTAMHATYHPKIYSHAESGEVVEIWDDTGITQYTVSYDGADTGDFDIDRTACTIEKINGALGDDHQIRYTYSLQRLDLVVINTSNVAAIREGTYTSAGLPQIASPAANELALRVVYVQEKATTLAVATNEYRDDRFYLPLVDQEYDVVIRNQQEFEYWFGTDDIGVEAIMGEIDPTHMVTSGGWTFTLDGTTVVTTVPDNTRILLLPCESGGSALTFNGIRGYLLTTRVKLGENVHIVGKGLENTIIAHAVQAGTAFETTYTETKTVGTTDGNPLITCTDTSNLKEGDVVVLSVQSEQFDGANTSIYGYKILGITTDVNITLDRAPGGTDGSATLYRCVHGIVLKDFVFDGWGGLVGPSGGAGGSPKYMDDNLFEINYAANSVFEQLVVNTYIGDGADSSLKSIYRGVSNYYCKVGNIRQCKIDKREIVSGFHLSEVHDIRDIDSDDNTAYGCVYECHWSYIHDIYRYINDGRRGAVYQCFNARIENIISCQALDATASGAAVGNCARAQIRNIVDCESGGDGGGVADSNECTIEYIRGCVAAGNGGGIHNCDQATIGRVQDCVATTGNGGGLDTCDGGSVEAIIDCTAGTDGGGASLCLDLKIGTVQGCTATAGDGGALKECDECEVGLIADCTAQSLGGAMDSCDDCRVEMIRDCTATTNGGGAALSCNRCHFGLIQDCTAGSDGGAAASGLDNVFDVIEGCTAGRGGAAYNEDNARFGIIQNCNSTQVAVPSGGALEVCDQCVITGGVNNCVSGDPHGGSTGSAVYNCNHIALYGVCFSNTNGVPLNFKTINTAANKGACRVLIDSVVVGGSSGTPGIPDVFRTAPAGGAAAAQEVTMNF